MPSHKNQHYVPRCHLKPFTLKGAGLAINAFNVRAQRGIQNAPVKSQCSRPYFYGTDLLIEKILQSTEEVYGRLVRQITSPSYILNPEDSLMIKRFICLLNGRTATAARSRALAMADVQDAIYTTREHKEDTDLSEEDIIRMALSTTVETWHIVDDLKVCLLRNKTDCSLFTSVSLSG